MNIGSQVLLNTFALILAGALVGIIFSIVTVLLLYIIKLILKNNDLVRERIEQFYHPLYNINTLINNPTLIISRLLLIAFFLWGSYTIFGVGSGGPPINILPIDLKENLWMLFGLIGFFGLCLALENKSKE